MKGMLIDVTRCVGCERCVSACVEANGLDADKAEYDKATSVDGLSDNRFTTIVQIEGRNVKKACMHCLEPSCVSACLVGGLTINKDGAIVYDEDKCIGCRYCMLSCPFHIPRYEWSKKAPFVKKCELCEDRLAEGKIPACAEVCPQDVILFGERSQLLKEAHRRIRNNPEKYINHVWGESEHGGTKVLYLSDVDLASLDWPEEHRESIPHMVEPVVEATPYIAGSVLAGVAGLNWIVKRRMALMKADSSDSKEIEGGGE